MMCIKKTPFSLYKLCFYVHQIDNFIILQKKVKKILFEIRIGKSWFKRGLDEPFSLP